MSLTMAPSMPFEANYTKPKKGQWSFVNNSGPNEDDEARRLIRANAMRDYWRRKKQHKQRNGKHTVIAKDSTADRDVIPASSLVPGSTSRYVWRLKEKPRSFQGTGPHSDFYESELAVDKDDSVVSIGFEDTRSIYGAALHCDGSSGTAYHWPIGQEAPGAFLSLGSDVIDPFNALPIGGSCKHNSFVLSHCKSPLSQALPSFGLVHTVRAKR